MVRGIALIVALASVAHADTPIDRPFAIEIDRADTPAGRTEFGFDGGAPLDDGHFGITLATGWLENPITIGNLEPVRRRQSLSIGGALAIGTIVLDGRIGGAHQIGDRLGTPLDKFVSTDLHLGARLRVAGTNARAAMLRIDASLPTGDDGDFAGEYSWSLAWRLIGRITLPGSIVAAATLGIRLRGAEVIVGDRLVGDEALFAAGVSVPVPALRPLWCEEAVRVIGEVVGVIGDDVGIGKSPSPIEAHVGIVSRVTRDVTVGVRAGGGITDELGSPKFRASVEVTYQH